MSQANSGRTAGRSSDTMLRMLTMHAVTPTQVQPGSDTELAASGTRLRPHTRWLAAAATAQRSATALLADADSDPRACVVPILDAWTSLVLATWPDEHVPSDMRLTERAEALQVRHGGGGEPARVRPQARAGRRELGVAAGLEWRRGDRVHRQHAKHRIGAWTGGAPAVGLRHHILFDAVLRACYSADFRV